MTYNVFGGTLNPTLTTTALTCVNIQLSHTTTIFLCNFTKSVTQYCTVCTLIVRVF